MLKLGDLAPAFTLASTSGRTLSLADLRGRRVVLYFYPKDDTPGCTRESCDFRDNLARLRGHGAVVLGVSRDSIGSHEKFKKKHALPFELLSDPDAEVGKAYGAFGPKMMYGKKVVGTIRSTFVIDDNGRIAALWSPVRVDGHVDAVLAALAGGDGRSSGPSIERSVNETKRSASSRSPAKRAKTGASSTARSARSKTNSARKSARR
jgi:peroxiredoxin Q/BCP